MARARIVAAGILGAAAGLVVSSACGQALPPSSDEPPAEDGGASDARLADAATDGGDGAAVRCGESRDAGVACGAAVCGVGQACCIAAGECADSPGDCDGGPVQFCHGPSDCPTAMPLCCRVMASPGSQCRIDCSNDRLCYGPDDCEPGEGCFEKTVGASLIWVCAACQ